eukprot:2427219-Pleurochrysis_carterae.AAC.4
MEAIIYTGLCAIFDGVLKVAVCATASGTCSCRILNCEWTVLYEWGHPVATLPVTNGTIRHIHRIMGILRINCRVSHYSTLGRESVSKSKILIIIWPVPLGNTESDTQTLQ